MSNNNKWAGLSQREKAQLISIYAKHGYTKLNDITNHYNKFQDSGDKNYKEEANKFAPGGALPGLFHLVNPKVTSPRHNYTLSSIIMEGLRTFVGENEDTSLNEPIREGGASDNIKAYEDTAQESFLLNKENQEEYFSKKGYTKLEDSDYGLVNKAVENYKNKTGKEVNIYQKNDNDIERNNLTVLGNISNLWFGESGKEPGHMGHFPSAIYADKNGNLYQNVWDFNDYGSDSAGNNGFKYKLLQPFANLLDKIGNPSVVTSGYLKLDDNKLYDFLVNINNTNNDELYKNLKNTKFKLTEEQVNDYLYYIQNYIDMYKGTGEDDKYFKLRNLILDFAPKEYKDPYRLED